MHRLSWILDRKQLIPSGYDINHKCRIRPCVNPKHLNCIAHSLNVKLRGTKQDLDMTDIIIEPKSPTKLQRCIKHLIECFSGVADHKYGLGTEENSKKIIQDIIKLKQLYFSETFGFDRDPEELLDNKAIKRKYFWTFNEILKQYKIPYPILVQNFTKIKK